jgi:hypothetical protein
VIPAWMDPDTTATGSNRCAHCGRWIEHRGRGVYWDSEANASCQAAMGFGHRPKPPEGKCGCCVECVPSDDRRPGSAVPCIMCGCLVRIPLPEHMRLPDWPEGGQ